MPSGLGSDGRSNNDTTLMWRGERAATGARRDRNEVKHEARLAAAVAAGRLDARPVNEYCWRVWHPSRPAVRFDYWPRTSKARGEHDKGPAFYADVEALVVLLAPPETRHHG